MFSARSRVFPLLTRMSKRSVGPGVYLHVSKTPSHAAANHTFDLKQNPLFEKYAAKLEHLKESQPEVYEERLAQLRAMYEPKPEPTSDEGSSVDPPIPDTSLQVKPKTLNSVMKVELLADKSTEEIENIWVEYHEKKDCVFAIIPADHYEEMQKRTEEFPLFLYPVPRQGGYEFFVQQYSNNSYHFTTLGAYQTHKENAPSVLELNYFTDIQQQKGVVLMRGEPDTNVLSVYEAQLLALQIKMYYGINAGLKFNLVRLFNNSPEDFRYMDLIKEFENYKKDSRDFVEEHEQT